MPDLESDFAQDLLRGAKQISGFLFNDPAKRRKVYHLAANSNLPTFKLGSMLCARRSSLLNWVEEQEKRKG